MSEISTLWHELMAKLATLKGKIDPRLHKDVEEIAAHATKLATATEGEAEAALKEEKPAVEAVAKGAEAAAAEAAQQALKSAESGS